MSARPMAIMGARGDGFVGVCAWCPDKLDADAWVAAQGLKASHGICLACELKMRSEVIFEAGERCGAPDLVSAERGSALVAPSRLVAFSCRQGGSR